jgi:hypothetical protein
MKLLVAVSAISLVFLTGCWSGGVMDIAKLPVSDEAITDITGSVTDTSVQKEAIYASMVKSRDLRYKQMYEKSGFNVKFKLVEVSPGVKIQMMEEVSFKETPRFEQPLPTGPSEHPAWRFGEKVLTKGMDTFLWWSGITAAKDILTDKTEAAQPKYYGDYNPQTAAPYIVEPTVIQVQ